MFIREINTSNWQQGTPAKILNVCNDDSELHKNSKYQKLDYKATYDVLIVKETEAQFSATKVVENYVTLHGFEGDDTMQVSLPKILTKKRRKIEFLGDSITAGFCNMCKVEPNICGPDPDHGITCEAQQHFSSSWANLICEHFQADCHIEAWSGFGMYENCCGGDTIMPDIYERTLATIPSANPNDPHGTIKDNLWNFKSWIPDIVVINLGTNDLLNQRLY